MGEYMAKVTVTCEPMGADVKIRSYIDDVPYDRQYIRRLERKWWCLWEYEHELPDDKFIDKVRKARRKLMAEAMIHDANSAHTAILCKQICMEDFND